MGINPRNKNSKNTTEKYKLRHTTGYDYRERGVYINRNRGKVKARSGDPWLIIYSSLHHMLQTAIKADNH
jgi:hypothetical protein